MFVKIVFNILKTTLKHKGETSQDSQKTETQNISMAALKPSLIDRAEDSDELYRLKAVILGDGTTGKTSLARRYIDNIHI